MVSLVSRYLLLVVASVSFEKTVWNDQETKELLWFLKSVKAQAGNGSNFKESVFTPILPTLGPLKSAGPIKTAKMCKTEWTGQPTRQ
ncbi:hypothetical protein SERLADRAFT_437580 [Serpula lacrymans var. lacrymans S7.9]|uniref:Uncharacterized protein n=1 Tax=Serpula lacrymans var. lacrymans (strain S7.9) TaxID=578457 RepID=F8NUF3_SERL9|nr:uncharacterized protein SERLADRAFT_437580 [Serpula lacrymans var. lacrymans S7.9]EGO25865.1 hypothetical protein SERLADRAFT_437580 [Serpula lacrymans var. lacrymans S7.9]